MKKRKSKFTPGAFALRPKHSSAGLGLFTFSPIKKGQCVVEYVGRRISQAEEYTSRSLYLFEVTSKITIDGRARSNIARYINHSCMANCEINIHKHRVYVFAKQNIKEGEELTYNYDKDYFDEYLKGKCRCPKCLAKRALSK